MKQVCGVCGVCREIAREAEEGSKPRSLEISSMRLTGLGWMGLKQQIHLENAVPESHKSEVECLGALSKVFLSRIIVHDLVKMFDQFPCISPKSMRNPTESVFENPSSYRALRE